MSNDSPRVTVLMPVYNNERYLPASVESILNQTYRDFEFIIVDDGSSDGSLQLLERYAEEDSRIRLSSRPNTGYTIALNEGLRVARGEFIARMDADDIAAPDRFRKQVQYLDDHPDCVVVGGNVLLIDCDGDPIREMCLGYTHEEIDNAHMLGQGGALIHPAVMIRKWGFDRVGEFREDYECAEDLDIFLRLAEVGKVANVPEVVLQYRQHLSSIGYSRADEQQRYTVCAVRDAHERRGIPLPHDWKYPIQGKVSAASSYRKWVWWALSGRNVPTARKYAVKAVLREPYRVESWRTLYCAMRGY
ncbi:MAG: glycosyltransferase [Candidatus Hydrogenedentes bacterium]|nr:glycosyltransferase [Candidatus Hydrogenedentota bacterium]